MKSRSVVKPPASTVSRSSTRRAFSGTGLRHQQGQAGLDHQARIVAGQQAVGPLVGGDPFQQPPGGPSREPVVGLQQLGQLVGRHVLSGPDERLAGPPADSAVAVAQQADQRLASFVVGVEAHQFDGFRANLFGFGPGQRRQQLGGRRGAVQLHQIQGPRAVAPRVGPAVGHAHDRSAPNPRPTRLFVAAIL